MKLTDLCVVFVMIFICLILPVELRIKDDREKFYLQKQFNRSMDRVVTDSLEDAVIEEDENGRVIVDEEQVYDRFRKMIALSFDVDDNESARKIYDSIYLNEFYDNDKSMSYEESENIRTVMENTINLRIEAERIKNYRRDTAFFRFTFPFSPEDSWSRDIVGPSFFVTFDPDDDNMPWVGYDRVVFSGGRIEKQVD